MAQPDLFWGYLPFWIVVYGTAVVAWTCLGRFALSFLVAPDSQNYIWRGFGWITAWPLRVVRVITPALIGARGLMLATAFWFFVLRYAAFQIFAAHDMAPRLGAG